MKSSHLTLLLIGLAVTLLFVIFPTVVYELGYVAPGFSDNMYNLNLYSILAIITACVAWGVAAIYYYAINSVRFDRWYHWLAMLAVVVVVTPVVCYYVNVSTFASNELSYGAEAFNFEITNAGWSALLFIIASFSMRWWSSNCRHTPIPQ